ncbi:MAG TPA: carboxymuconolactone decarboxylase family protein [Phycisphaerales bacterium]|nr:carboxymuconolactone decarboxylase family protein [Phycisphaerales bacterium]HMP38067.1 carboxymuconolactone decarboxylase family protein [Phycisphaerales bacterium]
MRVHPSDESIRTAFDRVRAAPVFAESAALVAAGGRPVQMLQAMAVRPEILDAFAAVSAAIYPGGIVEREVKELIILEISRRNACQFCTASHISMIRALGMSQAPLTLLENLDALPTRQRLAVEYARAAAADSNRIPEPFFDDLRSAFSEAEIVELTAMIGLISMLNIFNNCLENRYGGEYDRGSESPRP